MKIKINEITGIINPVGNGITPKTEGNLSCSGFCYRVPPLLLNSQFVAVKLPPAALK